MSDNTVPARFVGSGLRLPGESADQAMTENTVQHLAGHLMSRRPQSMGHGFEDEPLDSAEKTAEHVAQAAAFYHATAAARIRAALRPSS